MSAEKSGDDVLELLESLGKSESSSAVNKSSIPNPAQSAKEDDDILGFLDSLETSKSSSSSPSNQTTKEPEAKKQTNTNEVQGPDSSVTADAPDHSVADKGEDLSLPDPISSLTSWWNKNKGGLWDSATSAVKQAEARVRELQPEVSHTQKQAIDSLNGSISKFKLNSNLLQSTLSSVLETIAPPIVRHEQLHVHVFHDMVGYPSIDNIVYSVFERVMQQVEGGGPLVMNVQKGKERHRRGSDLVEKRELNIFKGPIDHAQKLAAASIDEFLRNEEKIKATNLDGSPVATSPTVIVDEEGRISASTEEQQPQPLVRSSNIYLSIQPSSTDSEGQDQSAGQNSTHQPVIISSSSPRTFQFIVYLRDPEHNIQFSTVSQSFPLQWAEWLDSSDNFFENKNVDPREWVVDWVEEGLGLSIGTVAQTYVCQRMAVSNLPVIN